MELTTNIEIQNAHVRAREAHVEGIRQEVCANLLGNITEAAGCILSTYVVAFAADGAPIRTDGNKLAIFGQTIWSTADKAQARAVAKNFNAQLGETATVQVVNSGTWRKARIHQLRVLIAKLQPIDSLVKRHTCSQTLAELCNAKGDYRPSIRCLTAKDLVDRAQLVALADAYDYFQAERGDSRRAYRS